MKALDFASKVIAVLVVALIVFTAFCSFVNTVAPMSKTDQAEQMAPTLELYRAFGLTKLADVKRVVDYTEQEAIRIYTVQASGEEAGQ